MANLSAPDLNGTMGISNTATVVPVASITPQTVQSSLSMLTAPTADMLRDLTEPGIQSAPIFG